MLKYSPLDKHSLPVVQVTMSHERIVEQRTELMQVLIRRRLGY
jgi:hypothetical protein